MRVYKAVYIIGMDMLSVSETRANLKAVMDKVVADRMPVVIKRPRGEGVVMISESDFASMEETMYLLRSPKNAELLLQSIAELDAGKGEERTLIEP